MDNNDKQRDFAEWLKENPVSSDLPAIKPEEMLICRKCGRKTPPTRPTCFYCGNELPISEIKTQSVKLHLRKLEDWEKGFNIVIFGDTANLDAEQLPNTARFLELEKEDLAKILSSGKSLPVARVESENQAKIIVENLQEAGIASRIVSDESLKTDIPTKRLRGIEFFEDRIILRLFNTEEVIEVKNQDLALIVVGAVYERKIESVESFKKKERGKVLDSSETGNDEIVIDLFPQNDAIGFRIEMNGFDFSCLGAGKSMLAKENLKKLAAEFRTNFAAAKFDADYSAIRAELGRVWEIREVANLGGVDRLSFGKFKRTNTITISNLPQFTKYARLQKHLL